MFSNKTLYKIIEFIEELNVSEIDRIVTLFKFKSAGFENKLNKQGRAISIFYTLQNNQEMVGPFGNSVQLELLEFLIERFHKKEPNWEDGDSAYNPNGPTINFSNVFSIRYKDLANSLKRDGYFIEGKTIRKALPNEIDEANTESELEKLLGEFDFNQSLSHLKQAIDNHTKGNWAGANSQFRTFFESLLIEISGKIVEGNSVNNAQSAWKLLTNTASPPFFMENLNEISSVKKPSYIPGLWARLNPHGSHPGLSDENDSTFRYHTCLVFAYYLTKRLKIYLTSTKSHGRNNHNS